MSEGDLMPKKHCDSDALQPMFIEKEPWERLQGESKQAFRAFNVYLDLPTGERTLKEAWVKLQKSVSYESLLMRWKTKWQWRSRCQAYDAAQLEKSREQAREERLRIYADGLALGRFFYKDVGTDLQHQFQGWSPGEPTKDDPTGEQNRTPYVKKNDFTVSEKIKLMTWGLNAAERYAEAQKSILMEQEQAELQDNVYDEAFAEVLRTNPDLHDAYNRLLGTALRLAHSRGERKPYGS
jgi:hypothetical protein